MQVAPYDKTIFQRTFPSDQLTFLTQFDGAPSNQLYRDKQFHKLTHAFVPGWMFHYGRDMSLPDALDLAMQGSATPVTVRGGRYVLLSGERGPYLQGRGFLWIDIQDGIALGGFYFQPTNGEPSPTLTIFSDQIKEDSLELSQLPPEFAADMRLWQEQSNVPLISTRYFIGDLKKRILLEHDEDFCSYLPGINAPPPGDCENLDATAADMDMNTAYYLEQVHYATNATAYMIVGQDQTAFIELRERTCRTGPDPIGCRIRLTHEHLHTITRPMPRRR